MAKMMLADWMKDTDERRAWYGGREIDGAFSSVGTVYDGIWRVRLAERFGDGAEFQAVRDEYVLVDVEEGPFPSAEWFDAFYESTFALTQQGRDVLASLSDETPNKSNDRTNDIQRRGSQAREPRLTTLPHHPLSDGRDHANDRAQGGNASHYIGGLEMKFPTKAERLRAAAIAHRNSIIKGLCQTLMERIPASRRADFSVTKDTFANEWVLTDSSGEEIASWLLWSDAFDQISRITYQAKHWGYSPDAAPVEA